MSVKMIGAIIIIVACGSVGFSMAAAHRQEENTLRQLLNALEIMSCELQQRLLPLPHLCQIAGNTCRGDIARLFHKLSDELERQIAPDATVCVDIALAAFPKLPPITREVFTQLGISLGQYNMEGQLNGLQIAKKQCQNALDSLNQNRDNRLRSYQTLGLCAGAALAILLL